MKFKIHQKDILKTLALLEKALPNKTVIESLKGIKIEVKKDRIEFIASKSELAIISKLNNEDHDIEIYETGIVVISGLHLINIIKKLNSTNYINFEKINNTLHIKTNKSHIELIEYEVTSYPIINFNLNNPKTITLSKELLKKGYSKTKYSISTNQLKQILTGINFNITNNSLIVSSTDSLRMSYFKEEIQTDMDYKFTISKNILQDLIHIFDLVEDEEFELNFSNSQFVIKTKNIQIKSKLIDGEFPEIERLIPTNISFSYEINARELANALERVVLLTDRNESVVTAKVEQNNLNLSSFHKFLGGIEEVCQISNLNGSAFEIAFDPQFVLDSISTFGSEDLYFEFVDEISGFVIKPKDNNNLINVISPIRMS